MEIWSEDLGLESLSIDMRSMREIGFYIGKGGCSSVCSGINTSWRGKILAVAIMHAWDIDSARHEGYSKVTTKIKIGISINILTWERKVEHTFTCGYLIKIEGICQFLKNEHASFTTYSWLPESPLRLLLVEDLPPPRPVLQYFLSLVLSGNNMRFLSCEDALYSLQALDLACNECFARQALYIETRVSWYLSSLFFEHFDLKDIPTINSYEHKKFWLESSCEISKAIRHLQWSDVQILE